MTAIPPQKDSSNHLRLRYAWSGLVFVALLGLQALHARFSPFTLSELHAYWLGRQGHFPFRLLPWSQQHFGGGAMALRLPLLLVFAVLLAIVLLGLQRLIPARRPALLFGVTLVLLAAFAAQQYFALKKARAVARAVTMVCNHVERAAAPGEPVVAQWNLAMPLYTYGSAELRQGLRSTSQALPGYPPIGSLSQREMGDEMIYVGSAQGELARSLLAQGFTLREDQMLPTDSAAAVAHYYQAAGAGIYFVSPPSAAMNGNAVSSKP